MSAGAGQRPDTAMRTPAPSGVQTEQSGRDSWLDCFVPVRRTAPSVRTAAFRGARTRRLRVGCGVGASGDRHEQARDQDHGAPCRRFRSCRGCRAIVLDRGHALDHRLPPASTLPFRLARHRQTLQSRIERGRDGGCQCRGTHLWCAARVPNTDVEALIEPFIKNRLGSTWRSPVSSTRWRRLPRCP